MSNQRIRDPVHDLIEFSSSELERTLWKVAQTRPFQRLRRIKQLYASERHRLAGSGARRRTLWLARG